MNSGKAAASNVQWSIVNSKMTMLITAPMYE